MNKKVSITELMTETAVLTIGLTFYYWCWVRTDWRESYTYIQNAVAGGIICFIFLISYRMIILVNLGQGSCNSRTEFS